MEESTCPYCDQLLVEGDKEAELCCSEPDMANKNGMNVCLNCGLVHGYEYSLEYLDFYENMYKIRRKSIYQRKYHIENVLNNICFKNRIDLTHVQRDRIYRVFAEISDIIPNVNYRRKRMISTRYIIKQLFMMMGLKYDFIPITRSEKTRAFYAKFWDDILQLKNAEILNIIMK